VTMRPFLLHFLSSVSSFSIPPLHQTKHFIPAAEKEWAFRFVQTISDGASRKK